jgi:hypothetical protein
MKQFTFSFTGKTKGALGLPQNYIVTTQGENLQAARLALYDTHEHVSNLRYHHSDTWLDFASRAQYFCTARLVSDGSHVGLKSVDANGNFQTEDILGFAATYNSKA